MSNNILKFPQPRPRIKNGLEVTEYVLKIGGDSYRVRRHADAEHKGGIVIITDKDVKPVLVFSSLFPADHIPQLLVAHRAGFKQGRALGRQEGLSIVPLPESAS